MSNLMFEPDDSPEEEQAEPQPEAEVAESPQPEPEPDMDARLRAMEEDMRESRAEAQREAALRQQMQEQLTQEREQYRHGLSAMQPPPVDPTIAAREQLVEAGIPADQLASFVENVAERVANKRMEETLIPFAQSANAQLQVGMNVPEFEQNKLEILRHMQGNPEVQNRYQQMVSGSPEGAAEYALMKWRMSEAQRAEAGMHADNDAAQAAKAEARTTAAPLKSQSNRVTKKPAQQEMDNLAAAYKHFENTGDDSIYRSLRLGPILDKVKWAEDPWSD